MTDLGFDSVYENGCTFEDFYEEFPDEEWDYLHISQICTMEFAEKYLDKFVLDGRWKFPAYFTRNPNLTVEFVEKHLPTKAWDWHPLCLNESLPVEFFLSHAKEIPESAFCYLSENPVITPEVVESNPDLPWVWYWNGHCRSSGCGMVFNPSITPEFAEKKLAEDFDLWAFNTLLKNPAIPASFIEKHIDKVAKWNAWIFVSHNTSIDLDFADRYIDGTWFVTTFSRHPGLTPEFVLRHKDLKWDAYELAHNSNFGVDFFVDLANSDEDFPLAKKLKSELFSVLSRSPNITLDFIEANVREAWYWAALSRNPVVTMEFVERHWAWPWVYTSEGIYQNPRITPDFIRRHLCFDFARELVYNKLCQHPFLVKEREERGERKKRERQEEMGYVGKVLRFLSFK